MSAILTHYVLDSASPEWLREMCAMESEAAVEDLYPDWRKAELASKHAPDPESLYGSYADDVAEATGIRRFGEL